MSFYSSHRSFDNYQQERPRPSFTSSLAGHLDPVIQKHLRRVYTTLFTAVSVAAAGSLVTLELYSRRQQWFATLCSFLVLPALLLFSYLAPHSKWRAPTFYAFSFIEGAATAPLISIVSSIDSRIPTIAFIGAASVFACCSISAIFARRRSYLFLGSLLFNALFGLVFVGFISSIWRSFMPYSLIMYGGLFVFLGFVLYDTQMIIEKISAGERDHLQHALNLFIDFIAIFKRVLIIMAKNNVERKRRGEDRERRSN